MVLAIASTCASGAGLAVPARLRVLRIRRPKYGCRAVSPLCVLPFSLNKFPVPLHGNLPANF
jgi:hypothetical protein